MPFLSAYPTSLTGSSKMECFWTQDTMESVLFGTHAQQTKVNTAAEVKVTGVDRPNIIIIIRILFVLKVQHRYKVHNDIKH